jgi:sulfate adenylyltransferase subunit 2
MILVNGMKKTNVQNCLIFERENENGQNVRVFNFKLDRIRCMELYREQEQIENPSIYFSHKRKVFLRRNDLVTLSIVYQEENEEIEERIVRFRTVVI